MDARRNMFVTTGHIAFSGIRCGSFGGHNTIDGYSAEFATEPCHIAVDSFTAEFDSALSVIISSVGAPIAFFVQ